ncbi:MAG: electron transfer flavoprotein subunit beta/FixA family protein [Desulfamplus sp.]|nr:electron transfer flavoprotein subunit beta/FixA family protein [Desulfamplus sp.]
MKIFVCVKHVPDSAATIVVKGENQIDEKITFLLNPYDEYAVTEAVKLKKSLLQGHSSSNQIEVIAISVGNNDATKTVRSAMEMGADRGILIKSDLPQDSISTAKALKAAIEQDGNPDIIFTGRESIDMVGMQTMFRLGLYFGFPVVNNIVKFTPDSDLLANRRVVVEALTEAGGRDIYDITLPCVLGAGRGLNTPIYPTFPDVVKARKREIKIVGFDDLVKIENQSQPSSKTEIIKLEMFAEKRIPKEIKGSSSEIAKEIVKILKEEAKVI